VSQRINSMLVAGYILLCTLLGGSSQIPWTNLALQLLGILILAWSAAAPRAEEGSRRFSAPDILLLIGLVVVLLGLIPLPQDLWAQLPGREAVAQSLQQLGYDPMAMTISETPYGSVATLFAAIPAIAAFAAMEKLSPSPRLVAAAVVSGMVLGVLLGALQVAGGIGSWAYLYHFTNAGAVGFFANQNHMATLLLVSIPLGAALLGSSDRGRRSSRGGRYLIAIALLALVLLGVVLNHSLASLVLVLPVMLASFTLVPAGAKWRRVALPVTGVALVAAVAVLAVNPIASSAFRADASSSVGGRSEIWSVTSKAVAESFPVGTGLGSFEQVYRGYENPDAVTTEYVNHAHNDYLELVLELGAPGLLLLVLFLAWWAVAAVRIWSSKLATPFVRAATIVTAAVLAHSFVDFPLRTAAIASIFGAMVGLMAQQLRSTAGAGEQPAGGVRHVSLG